MPERPHDGVKPFGIFKRTINDGSVRAVGRWLDFIFHLLREQPIARVIAEVIKQILRLQRGHDVSSNVLLDVGQREFRKEGVHSYSAHTPRARSK